MSQADKSTTEGIAIVGMAGRFPKARNIDEFWLNLCTGVEAISFFTDEELSAAGAAVPKGNPHYVKARGVLEDADLFDAAFFGVTPREAAVMDPQHRVFLECAWEALENAGYDSEKFDGAIGVFAGMSMNTYLAANLHGHPELMASLNAHQIMLANDKDYLPTRVSYKLNLRGPSLNIQTACSTSLVAVCVACQQLLNYQCDLALAGAVAVSFPQKQGHLYQEGGIGSPDGHCRAFDAQAAGTVAGEGVGIVVLKRLEDALADGDQIYAVIKGFATNNDGANKIGYTAPSVAGQAEVIALAQAMAGVEPETITYIEAHGTGTPLGDPIEVEALTQAFRSGTAKKNFCALGSVKSSIGHLDTAAGVTGLIKAALALHHRQLPPSLHFETPNPKIDFANSPFFVVKQLTEWQRGFGPHRAGVSSFGIGGTNAHVVLEEAPPVSPLPDSEKPQLLVLSAKSATALDQATANLAERLKRPPGLNLADVAWTLQTGRHEFTHRRMLVCRDAGEAMSALESRDAKHVFTRVAEQENPPVVFMFPGQGAQRVNMGRELYEHEPVFREQMDRCCEVLTLHLGFDLRTVLYPSEDKAGSAAQQLTQTAITQPALFAVEYALARLWMSWGVQPAAMIGHSIGEYVAACLSGVFSLDTALALVAERGRRMQEMPAGTMLAVRLPEAEVRELLGNQLSVATVNGASLCVVSGPEDAVEALRLKLAERGTACTPLETSHAFHSAMMEPMLGSFTELVRSVGRNAPQIPFISNVTGTWITAEQATDPAYWAKHLRQTVRFADGAGELLKVPERVLLEVGPGQTLNSLAKQHPARDARTLVLSSLPRAKDESPEHETLLAALGQLWLAGVRVDWRGLHGNEQRRRVWLPAYPFERKRYFIEPAATASLSAVAPVDRIPVSFLAPARSARGEEEENGNHAGRSAPSTGDQPVKPATRYERVVAELRTLLSDLSGLNLAGTSDTATFTELGFESLFLTQASLAIEKKCGIRVAFRQLLEEANSLARLASYIDQKLPANESSCLRVPPRSEFSPPPATKASVAGSHGNGSTHLLHALDSQPSAGPTRASSLNRERRLNVNLEEEVRQLRNREERIRETFPVKDIRSYPGLETGLNELCSAYVCDCFRACGIRFERGQRFRIAELRAALRLRPAFEKFFRYLLGVLADDGIIRLGEDDIEGLREREASPDSAALHARLAAQFPEFAGLLAMLKHCASNYRDVLSGEISGVSVLLPDGSHQFLKERLQGYTDEHRSVRIYEHVAKELVLNLSRTRPLRILEVGGGGGDLTWKLVPELAGRGCEYCFTDIGKTFVQDARKEASRRGLDFMSFGALDISKAPGGQGFEAGSFDVVLALNVVHATPHLDETLAHLKQLLVPGGLVCMVELTMNWRWDNLIIGLVEGWWLFDDEFRKTSPLIELSSWEKALRNQGFYPVSVLPENSAAGRAATDAGLILAQWQGDAVASKRLDPQATQEESVTRSLALTPAQAEVWFASQLSDEASCAYNDSRLLHFRGALQVATLRQALQQLLDRHEALRTTFSPRGDLQFIRPSQELELKQLDLSEFDEVRRAAELEALETREASQPFDLARGPLLRALLVKLSAEHHVLLLTIHHLACDGHSWGILLRDLSELYSAGCRGVPAPLPAAWQISDFALEQTQRHSTPEHAASEAFWIEQFADGGPIMDLPTGSPRPSTRSFEGARECGVLGGSVGEALKRLSVEHDCTLFTTLLAAHYVFLHRLTGQPDLVIGVPTADRIRKESDTLVGHCVNFLPVRMRITGEPTFGEFVAEVKRTFLKAYEHRDYTLGSLIQKLNLPRDPDRSPLATVTFNLDRLRGGSQFAGLETELALNSKSYSNFDFSLNVTETDGELHFDCRFVTSLISPETMRRWVGHFQTLLQGIAARPDQRISELPMLPPDERQRILVEWNNTQADYERDRCMHELFEEQVARTPEAVAAVCGNQSLTYSELNENAERLAQELRRLGVGPDVPVGICVERSLEMIAGVLGILKAGGAYVPLDPAYPKERIALMLTNARVPVLLTQESLATSLPESQARMVYLDRSLRVTSDSEADAQPRSPVLPSNLAYVIHTSGSTGAPKGVAIEHRNAVNFIHWAQRVFSREELAGVLFSTSLCFDLSVFELFVTLSSGGKVILATNALELPSLPAKDKVTLLNTVPSAATELLRLNAIPPSVRVVNLAGEALSSALVDRLYALGTVKKVHDLYGPSETTTYSTFTRRLPGGPATIGRPIANTQVYLLDANRQPVPVGVLGEIYIGGEGVARGYLHRPDLTEERFVPDPFSNASGARLYRTGDLARWLPDGNLEFLGRKDHQVKIRGFRVELGEVESVLGHDPAVQECVVVARPGADADQRLIAYVVANPDRATTAGDLRRLLESKLPDYMVPADFVFLDALPLTPSGKLDRRALPAPDRNGAESEERYVAPDTPTEQALAAMWCELLDVPRVGVHDNFFELGGHSLLVTRFIVRVREAFQVELPLRRVFQTPTIAALAGAVEEMLVAQVGSLSDEEARRALHGA